VTGVASVASVTDPTSVTDFIDRACHFDEARRLVRGTPSVRSGLECPEGQPRP